MENKRNRRSKRLEPQCSGGNNTQLETPNTGNDTVKLKRNTSLDINFGTKSNYSITKIRKEMDSTLETTLKEIRSIKSLSTTTNPRSKAVGTQNPQPSGSRTVGVHASNVENF